MTDHFDRRCSTCGRATRVRTDGRWQRHQDPCGGVCAAAGTPAEDES